jgi:hypothetical protein
VSARTTPAPGQRDHWSNYGANTLHRILVEDALAAHATDLKWLIGALQRIQQITKRPLEEVFAAIVTEVESMGMHMPMHSGPIA